MVMRDLFLKFIQSPSRDTYLAIHEAVSSSDQYSPYSDEMDSIHELLDQGRYEDARSRISESMPNLLLSPRAHLFLALIAEKTGDEKGSQMEKFIAASCAEGIMATGDGSLDRPYIVLRTSDEHDIVDYCGKQFAGQALIDKDTRHFDRISCADGSELWFDITIPYNKLQEQFGG
jgi:hypothetical protein